MPSHPFVAGVMVVNAPPVADDRRARRAARRRPIRVMCLVAGIVAMSLADLVITLIYLKTVGMGESNPIARYVMQRGSDTMLIAWKCASIALACLVFLRYRNRRSTEAACWFATAVLVWLLVRWTAYADEAWRLTPALHTLADAEHALWVKTGE